MGCSLLEQATARDGGTARHELQYPRVGQTSSSQLEGRGDLRSKQRGRFGAVEFVGFVTLRGRDAPHTELRRAEQQAKRGTKRVECADVSGVGWGCRLGGWTGARVGARRSGAERSRVVVMGGCSGEEGKAVWCGEAG